jgi:glycosyltransferase involved in cell wall biosynthesis
MPLVSVIVPTFNRQYCIARAIDSARAQTHADVEVIVIDDGSTDGTGDYIRDRYATDVRVRYIRQENHGVSAARNAGLRQVRGEYVAFLDSDDVWRPWKLELQLRCFERQPHIGMVWSDMVAIDGTGTQVSPRHLREMYSCWNNYPDTERLFETAQLLRDIAPDMASIVGNERFYTGEVFSPMIRGSLVHTSTVVLRRERADRVGGFNVDFKPAGEDYDFHLRTCQIGPVGFLDLPTIDYLVGSPDQLTRPPFRVAMARNFLRAIEPMIQRHRAQIRLPQSQVNEVLAEAHQWLGEELFWRQHWAEARRHLATSLRYRVSQPRAIKLLVASLLPFKSVWLSGPTER